MRKAEKLIRVDYEVAGVLIERMRPQESFNGTLRRILKLKANAARIKAQSRETK